MTQRASYNVENTASIRILEKLGFRVECYREQCGKRVAYYTCRRRSPVEYSDGVKPR